MLETNAPPPIKTFTNIKLSVRYLCRPLVSLRMILAPMYRCTQIHVMLLCDIIWRERDIRIVHAQKWAVTSSVTLIKLNTNTVNPLSISLAHTNNVCIMISFVSLTSCFRQSFTMIIINAIFSKNIVRPNIVVKDVATESIAESFVSVLTVLDVEFIVSIGRSMGLVFLCQYRNY